MALDSRQKRAAVIGTARAWYRNPHPSNMDESQRAAVSQVYPVASFSALAPPVFAGTIPDITGNEGDADIVTDLSVYFTGATSYSISPAVEAGWSFDTGTGILTVDTDDANTFGPYTVTGTNAAGSDSSNAFDVIISTVADKLADPGTARKRRQVHPAWRRMEERLKKEYERELEALQAETVTEPVPDPVSVEKPENYLQSLLNQQDQVRSDIDVIEDRIDSLEAAQASDKVVVIEANDDINQAKIYLELARTRELKLKQWIAALEEIIKIFFY